MYAHRHLPTIRLPIVLLATLLCGCHGHHAEHHHGPPVYGEQEPNDWADHPDHIGTLDSQSHLFIEGHVQEVGPDVYDGFHFFAAEPCTVEFALDAHEPADLDLAVYDPFVGDFVLFFESPYDPELGSFVVLDGGQEFHMVVRSFQGSSHYTLEVVGLPPEAAPHGEDQDAPHALAPRAADAAALSRVSDPRALFTGYRERAPAAPVEEEAHAPALLLRLDEHGRILEVVPVLLTAGGAAIALLPSRPAAR